MPLTFAPQWGWVGTRSVALLLLAAASLVAFVFVERRASDPLIDLDLLVHNRLFAAANTAALLNYMALFAISMLTAVFLQVVQGRSAALTGWIMLSQPLMQAVLAPVAGRFSDRVGSRVLATGGMVLTAVGMVLLGSLPADAGLPRLIASLAVVGVGMAAFSAPNTSAVMGSVGRHQLGLAGAFLSTMRSTGMALSVAILGGIAASQLGRDRRPVDLRAWVRRRRRDPRRKRRRRIRAGLQLRHVHGRGAGRVRGAGVADAGGAGDGCGRRAAGFARNAPGGGRGLRRSHARRSAQVCCSTAARQAGLEVLLVHPGGPYWAKKDAGAWSIPKGEAEPGELGRRGRCPSATPRGGVRLRPSRASAPPRPTSSPSPSASSARRRASTRTPWPRPAPSTLRLAASSSARHKIVYVWALEGDCDPAALASNEFEMEWPPRSGRTARFPEVDRAAWFDLPTAHEKILTAQRRFLDDLTALSGA